MHCQGGSVLRDSPRSHPFPYQQARVGTRIMSHHIASHILSQETEVAGKKILPDTTTSCHIVPCPIMPISRLHRRAFSYLILSYPTSPRKVPPSGERQRSRLRGSTRTSRSCTKNCSVVLVRGFWKGARRGAGGAGLLLLLFVFGTAA